GAASRRHPARRGATSSELVSPTAGSGPHARMERTLCLHHSYRVGRPKSPAAEACKQFPLASARTFDGCLE
ncbi:MAG: hypothetical protein J1E79_06155, partial [Rikenella sp.]|nr:hypothetical protein [Rikenella sp.]